MHFFVHFRKRTFYSDIPGMFIMWQRYQASRCTYSVLISTNGRRVNPIRLNAKIISKRKVRMRKLIVFAWLYSEYYNQ